MYIVYVCEWKGRDVRNVEVCEWGSGYVEMCVCVCVCVCVLFGRGV